MGEHQYQVSHDLLDKLWTEMEKVVVGRGMEFKLLLTSLVTGGHVLFEDLPGTGKTTMMKAFAMGLDCDFTRIQCTPDLLPTDVIGGSIFNPKTNEFYMRKGPVFTNILLVDEINRALPRTQSSLLECMEENQVTIEGETFTLEKPFIVLATQNPVDMEGTFPLPEAQMDRFLMKLDLGYPSQADEAKMLLQVGDTIPFDQVKSIFHPEQIEKMQEESRQVRIHEAIVDYITTLARATREDENIAIGVSPRGSKALFKAVKSWAYLSGRNYVIPDDVKEMLVPVWSHRITLKTEVRMNETDPVEVLEKIMAHTEIPEEKVVYE